MHFNALLARLGRSPLSHGIAISLSRLICFAIYAKWNGISLTLNAQDLAGKMSPLILASTFVERAVEILTSPWRDLDASKLERLVIAIKARPSDATTPIQNALNAADLEAPNNAVYDTTAAKINDTHSRSD